MRRFFRSGGFSFLFCRPSEYKSIIVLHWGSFFPKFISDSIAWSSSFRRRWAEVDCLFFHSRCSYLDIICQRGLRRRISIILCLRKFPFPLLQCCCRGCRHSGRFKTSHDFIALMPRWPLQTWCFPSKFRLLMLLRVCVCGLFWFGRTTPINAWVGVS